MKRGITRIAAWTSAILAAGAVYITGLNAQQSSRSSRVSTVTTNWVGYLVVGQHDLADPITPNPSPTVSREVEIGLRSDGVVVWRPAGGPVRR